MRKIIVPVGYMGSGSSAVTDLISEFDGVNNEYGEFEYVFLHCPDGVFDLEDKLLKGNNALRSDEAVRTFLSRMKKLYNKKLWWVGDYKNKIGNNFYNRSVDYIDELINFKLDNYWYMQENTNLVMFIKLIIRKLVYILSLKKIELKKPLLYSGMNLAYPTEKEFYNKTSKYIYDIFKMIDDGNSDLLLDQLVLPHNLHRVNKYFKNDVKFIVVDRDPRDIYILNKYFWSKNNEGVPYSHDVDEFCEQYKKIRELEKCSDDKNILRIQFEDMIYKYEETKEKIINFLNYNERNHLNIKRRFNPEKSKNNVRLYLRDEYLEESKIIEKKLEKYLYK